MFARPALIRTWGVVTFDPNPALSDFVRRLSHNLQKLGLSYLLYSNCVLTNYTSPGFSEVEYLLMWNLYELMHIDSGGPPSCTITGNLNNVSSVSFF